MRGWDADAGSIVASSVATSPGLMSAVPVVTTSGRPVPSSALASASIALRSVSAALAIWEKSWT